MGQIHSGAHNWPQVPIRQIASLAERPEVPIPGQTYRQIGVRLWGQGAYERDSIDGSETRYATLNRVEADDIIVNKIWARNGSVAVVSPDLSGCFGSSEFPTFAPVREKLYPRWFHWITKTSDFWQQCDKKSQGTSGKNRIRPEQFLSVEIPLPPLAEQQRVVARIEALARRVEEARGLRAQAVEEASSLSASALDAAFQSLSSQFHSKAIQEVCDVVRGGSPRPAGDPLYYGGDIPFIKVGDITKDEGKFLYEAESSVNELGQQHSRFIPARTLMLTNSGATLGVPKITMIAGCFNDGSQAFLNLNPMVFDEYLYYFFKSKTRWFRETPARGQGQPNLNIDMVKPLEFPCPPHSEQHRIVAYLDGLQAKVDELKRLQAETQKELDALMPSVLAKAFAGEL
jgi:type I restriction enzyme S subunit